MESHPPEKIHWVCHLGENSSKNQRMKIYQFYVLEHQNTSYGDIEIVDKNISASRSNVLDKISNLIL